jgi:glycosyltransferase involved in cell wall biosynthesis
VIAAGNTAAKKIAFVHCDVSVTHVLTKYYRSDKACHNEYVGFDKVCFVSEAAKEGFESTVGLLSNASVVRNVIDFEEIRQKAEEPVDTEFDTAGMKILCVGRLAKEKAYDRVIRIAAELEKTYRFQIYILGEGDQRSSLEKLVAEKNVKSVKLLGFKSNPYPYMKKADLLICSSLFEGYSTVVAEALLLGLPVLTTRCAGMEELLKAKEDGVIVENSEAALREGLAKILQDRIGGRSI